MSKIEYKQRFQLSKEYYALKEFNMALHYLGFNPSRKAFSKKDLEEFLSSDFFYLEDWYKNRIK